MFVVSAGISISCLEMKWWWPTCRGLQHGWWQISFSSLICVWDEQPCWPNTWQSSTHTHKHTQMGRQTDRKHQIWFIDLSTQPAPYHPSVFQQPGWWIENVSVLIPVGKSEYEWMYVYLLHTHIYWSIGNTSRADWGMHNYKQHPFTHTHTHAVQQKSSLLFTKEAEKCAIDWLWEWRRGECSLAFF